MELTINVEDYISESDIKEAKRENKTAPEGTTFVVKAHAFADGNEFMLLSEK